jgi:hypothetical protein
MGVSFTPKAWLCFDFKQFENAPVFDAGAFSFGTLFDARVTFGYKLNIISALFLLKALF